MTQESASYREDVEQLRRRFEEFRSTHALRSRLPEELWAAAAKLARQDGMETTARALDVDRPSLKKWMDRFDLGAPPRARKSSRRRQPGGKDHTAPAFVELLAETAGRAFQGTSTSCLVEVESPRGSKLRLELKAVSTNELAEFIRVFAAS